MAQFVNSNLSLQTPQEYTRASVGVDKPKPNEAMYSLFKGMGNLLDQTVAVTDQAIKGKIDKELYGAADQARDNQGVGDMAASGTISLFTGTGDSAAPGVNGVTPASPNAEVPKPVNSVVDTVTRLTKARENGSISDVQYWSQVEAATRMVRARFPGYRQEIDQKIASIVGTTPANALRTATLSAIDDRRTAGDNERKELEKFVNQNQQYITPGDMKQWLDGDRSPELVGKIRASVYNNQKKDYEAKSELQDLHLKEKQGNLREGEALETAYKVANSFVQSQLNNVLDNPYPGAEKGMTLLGMIQKIAKDGKPMTPEVQQYLGSQLALLETNLTAGLSKLHNSPLSRESTSTLSSLIKDSSKLEGVKKSALEVVTAMRNALTNGDYGLFAANANMIKSMNNSNMAELLRKSGAAQKLKLATELLGPYAGMYLSQITEGGGLPLTQVGKDLHALNVAGLTTGSETPEVQLRRMAGAGAKPADFDNWLKTANKLLSDPNTNAQVVENMANMLFSRNPDENWGGKLDLKSQRKVFSYLTSPEVLKKLQTAGGTNPALMEKFSSWATNQFYALNSTLRGDAKELQKDGIFLEVDPATGRLSAGGALDRPPLGADGLKVNNWQMTKAKVEDYVEAYNSALSNLIPIYKASGRNPTKELMQVYKEIGVKNLDAVTGKGAGSSKTGGNPSEADSSGSAVEPSDPVPTVDPFTDEEKKYPLYGVKDTISFTKDEDRIGFSDKLIKAVSSNKMGPILDLVSSAESGSHGYDASVGNRKVEGLTNMTISQVYEYQSRMLKAGSESTAIGRYQFVKNTLKRVVDKLGYDPETTKFTPEVQDRLAVALMGRDAEDFLSGKMNEGDFLDSLAQHWAGLPLKNGFSAYHGVGSNRATISRYTGEKALRDFKKSFGSGGETSSQFQTVPERNALKGLLNLKATETQRESKPKGDYPTSDDAELALKSGFAYGSPDEIRETADKARVFIEDPTTTNGVVQLKDLDSVVPNGLAFDSKKIDKVLKELNKFTGELDIKSNPESTRRIKLNIVRGVLASKKNPISNFGLDLNNTTFDISGINPKRLGGVTSGYGGAIIAREYKDGVLLHENFHNGLIKLENESPEVSKLLKEIAPSYKANEDLVRYLVHKNAGNVEERANSKYVSKEVAKKFAQEQILRAEDVLKSTFPDGKTGLQKLKRIEEIAADLFTKKNRPMGPR